MGVRSVVNDSEILHRIQEPTRIGSLQCSSLVSINSYLQLPVPLLVRVGTPNHTKCQYSWLMVLVSFRKMHIVHNYVLLSAHIILNFLPRSEPIPIISRNNRILKFHSPIVPIRSF